MHRPRPTDMGLHTSLLHPALAELFDDVWGATLQPSADDYRFILNICAAMANCYDTESLRMSECHDLWSVYLDSRVTNVAIGKYTSDGTISAEGPAACFAMVLNLEVKNELGSSGSSGVEQSVGYYVSYLADKGSEHYRKRSVCPAILLHQVGPYFGVSAAAYDGDVVLIDPVTPLHPLLVLPSDRPLMEMFARAVAAVKKCVAALKSFYATVKTQQLTRERRRFAAPYPVSVTTDAGEVIRFAYLEQLFDSKWVYRVQRVRDNEASAAAGAAEDRPSDSADERASKRARASLSSSAANPRPSRASSSSSSVAVLPAPLLPRDDTMIVKFTRTYSAEAHRCMYDYQQAAPRLIAYEALPGGWFMVVMEDLREADGWCHVTQSQRLSSGECELLKDAVAHLHRHGFVHGDLRPGNVLVRDGSSQPLNGPPRVCVIDFDWAGPLSAQRYPSFMNHAEVIWPNGATDGALIHPEHDLAWLELL